MLTQQGGRRNDVAQLVKSLFVGRTGNPEADIAIGGVFLIHVLVETLPMLLIVKFGVVGKAELNGTAENDLSHDVAVGFGNNLPIERTRCVAGRCAVVFYRFLHDFDLFCRKPALQSGVGSQYLTAGKVVDGTGPRHAEVVIGGNNIDHIDIGTCGTHQVQGVTDDTGDVLQIVGTVELGVLRQDVRLDKLHQIKARTVGNHKKVVNMFANVRNSPYFCKKIRLKMNETTNIRQDSLKAWLLAARPKTLTGAAVPVMIGVALAWGDAQNYEVEVFSWTAAVLCFLFAFIMQIDANFINDFFDFANGADDKDTRLGPRRACAQGWVSLDAMKKAIALTTIAACIVGLPLVWYGGLEMILIGALCLVFCFLYTTHLSYLGLGDVLVLVFFGIVPVCISYYVQLHTCTWQVFLASVACGLVIDALLLINNFRDREGDAAVGKMTLVVRIGEQATLGLYLGVGVVACLLGLVFWLNGHVLAFVLPLLYLLLHVYTYLKIKRIYKGKALNLCLGETARNIFVYGLTVAAGLLLS